MSQQENKVIADSGNLHAVLQYVKSMRELRKFMKTLSKRQREGLSMNHVYSDMVPELDDLERQMNKYIRANIKDYVHKDMYLHGSIRFSSCIYNGNNIYIHVINIDKNNIIIDYVAFDDMDTRYKPIEANDGIFNGNGEHTSIIGERIVESVIDGTLKETTKDVFDEAVSVYKEICEKINSISNYGTIEH